MIIVIVKPSGRDDGSKAYSTRGQLFDGYVSERLVVSRSTQPLLDACRVLARDGVDRKGPPAFGVWQPFKGSQASGIEPSMRQNEEAGVG